MEKLNLKNDVSRETSENEIKIVFKKRNTDIIAIHTMCNIYDKEYDFEKIRMYINELLRLYKEDGYALVYINGKYKMMVDIRDLLYSE